MVDLNMTQICSSTPQQLIDWASSTTATPALIILFIAIMLAFLGVGLPMVKNRAKYLTIWIFCFIISGIVLIALIFLPNTVQSIVNWFSNLFG
jgi:hypothetical protein